MLFVNLEYLKQHWRGELSLPKAFWLNQLLSYVAAYAICYCIGYAATTITGAVVTARGASMVAMPVALVTYVWWFCGTWRSASKRPDNWGRAAQVVMMFGLMKTLMDLVNLGAST